MRVIDGVLCGSSTVDGKSEFTKRKVQPKILNVKDSVRCVVEICADYRVVLLGLRVSDTEVRYVAFGSDAQPGIPPVHGTRQSSHHECVPFRRKPKRLRARYRLRPVTH